MNPQVMAEIAPQFALPPRGQWITPENGGNQPLYGGTDSNGERIPLPYLRQGGQTEYYSPNGTAGLSTEGNPITAVARRAPAPIEGIRGRLPDDMSINIQPNNLMAPTPVPAQPGAPRRGPTTARMTPETVIGDGPPSRGVQHGIPPVLPGAVPHGQPVSPANIDQHLEQLRGNYLEQQDSRYQGRRETLDIPGARRPPSHDYVNIDGRLGNSVPPLPNQNVGLSQDVTNAGGQSTLLDMFRQLGFEPPEILGGRPQGPGSIAGADVGRYQPRGAIRYIRGTQDVDVQRTAANQVPQFHRPANAGQWEGRAPEIEAWVRAGNIRLTAGAGYRTNNSLPGGHGSGNSLDVPPNELEAVIARIRSNPEYANIPIQPTYIRRGQVVGHRRDGTPITATGDHYHIDFGPAAER